VRVTLDVDGFAPDCCGGEDEVEHLVEPEVGADLVCLMRSEQLWSPGGEDAVAAAAEDGVGGVGVPEELGRDRVLAVVEQCEAPQPGEQHFPGGPDTCPAASHRSSTSPANSASSSSRRPWKFR